MSIITVHGPQTMGVQKQSDVATGGALATHVNLTDPGKVVSWVGGDAPSNVAELRDYVSGDLYINSAEDDSTWVGIGGGGAKVTLATGRSYYWDGTEWVEDSNGAPAA